MELAKGHARPWCRVGVGLPDRKQASGALLLQLSLGLDGSRRRKKPSRQHHGNVEEPVLRWTSAQRERDGFVEQRHRVARWDNERSRAKIFFDIVFDAIRVPR